MQANKHSNSLKMSYSENKSQLYRHIGFLQLNPFVSFLILFVSRFKHINCIEHLERKQQHKVINNTNTQKHTPTPTKQSKKKKKIQATKKKPF